MSYDPITGIFTWLPRHGNDHESHRWSTRYAGRAAGTLNRRTGYLLLCVDHTASIPASHAAWALTFGDWPTDQLDHIDGNKIDNAIGNLRPASPTENSRNRSVRNDSLTGARGVQMRVTRKGTIRWVVRIATQPGQRLNIGSYRTREAAMEAYARASREHHGEFGRVSAIAALDQGEGK